jgi:hypothetical protein
MRCAGCKALLIHAPVFATNALRLFHFLRGNKKCFRTNPFIFHLLLKKRCSVDAFSGSTTHQKNKVIK